MLKKLLSLKDQVVIDLKNAITVNEVGNIKALYLGKKSPLQELMAKMKDLSIEEKKEIGMATNEFKRFVEDAVIKRLSEINELEIQNKLNSEEIDVTLPGRKFRSGKLHPLTKIARQVEEIFIGMGYKVEEGPEIEQDLYNFEMLNLPKGHPAREMQDSFYIDNNTLLRTHTSPVQVRTLLKAKGEPVKIICPGKVYRRDNDDATHSHQFMQIEGLVVDKNITMADLKGTLELLCKRIFGENLKIRLRPSFFPFTEPSVEVDVTCFKCGGNGCGLCKQSGWIEVLGAGMVHPNVLEMAGYDSKVYQGFAFGLGIERFAMLKYEIDDIRHFYTNDPRFLKQF
ncbi:MAG: phenylalanine--tRNA ligase subunit alpha [Bacilli bacterium]|nr:phenylalanine--tRNA ligase subunit alpha [Bacilli bacterium]